MSKIVTKKLKMNKEKLREHDIFIKDLSSGRKVIIDVNYPRKNTKKIIRNIAKKIGDNYKPEKIILFGSYAYGKPKKDSDIDLLIIKKTKARHIERAIKVREIVKEENRFFAIEPLVYTPKEIAKRMEMEDDFIKTILDKGVILYG